MVVILDYRLRGAQFKRGFNGKPSRFHIESILQDSSPVKPRELTFRGFAAPIYRKMQLGLATDRMS